MTEEPNRLHNVAAINQTINDNFKKILDLESHIAELMEEHIKPLKKEVSKIKKTNSADTGVDSTDLTLFYKIYKRQELAKVLEDEDDRGRIADNLRTAFGAMVSGQTLDFIDVLENGHTPQVAANDQAEIDAEEAAVK